MQTLKVISEGGVQTPLSHLRGRGVHTPLSHLRGRVQTPLSHLRGRGTDTFKSSPREGYRHL